MKKLSVTSSIEINAPVERIWQAFTDPQLIKEYLFGTSVVSDWKKGSPITYSGEWNGKKYQDKGVIVDIEPHKVLHTTYLSSMSGKEDKPENYNNVVYEIKQGDGHNEVSITQDNIETEQEATHMRQNWTQVLQGMKQVLEK